MLALTTMTVGLLQANEVTIQTTETKIVMDEQAFAAQLSESHRALFSAMTAEQKAAAMTAAAEPNQAVEQVIQNLASHPQR